MGMLLSVLLIFLAAAIAPAAWRFMGDRVGLLMCLVPGALAVYFATLIGQVADGETIRWAMPWVPGLSIELSFFLDGLSLLFALLITGIGSLVCLYAGSYLKGHEYLGRFYLLLLIFMGSMLGLVLSDNLLSMFVFWELTSISSYLLIGFDHENEKSRKSALQALLVTAGGGLALLAGLVLMGYAAGSFELSEILSDPDVVRDHGLYMPILLLVCIGCFTKSAQFPFHFWLPNAMAAPTPISAYLHSSTMVKAGVYLLARMHPSLGDTEAWLWIVGTAGAATMAIGGFLAMRQSVLKPILAYTTVSSLGTITLLLGLGTEYAAKAAMAYLLAHALYKAALFLIAGIIDHETGEKDTDKLGGLAPKLPITTIATIVSCLSLAGVPLLFGFVAKETFLVAAWTSPLQKWAIVGASVFGATAMVFAAALLAYKPFFAPRVDTPKDPHEAPVPMLTGPVLLGILSLVLGVMPFLAAKYAVGPAAWSVMGPHTLGQEIELKLWHGWQDPYNAALILSGLGLAFGLTLYVIRPATLKILGVAGPASKVGPEQIYHWVFNGLYGFARFQTRTIQNGSLRFYLVVVVSTTIGFVGYTLLARLDDPIALAADPETPGLRSLEVIIIAVVAGAAILATRTSSRLGAVASLGVVGYGVALLYILFGAPDLAMTQFAIETLTVILFVLIFHHLPPFRLYASGLSKKRDLALGIGLGVLMGMFVLVASAIQVYEPVSEFHAANTYEGGKGRNVVNVILVDFRSIDTLGEVVVVALAGIGVYSLLRLSIKRRGGPQ